MKLLDKIKNAIFEDDEFEELEETLKEEPKQDKKEEKARIKIDDEPGFKKQDDEVVKKIDIEKTVSKKSEISKEEPVESVLPKREHRKTPVIFDEEDFILEDLKEPLPKKEPIKKEEPPRKPLYGGYKEDKVKEKFKPSPVISPVYGFVGVSPILEQPRNDELSSFNEMLKEEKKEELTLDDVRQKAYGLEPEKEEDDDLGLLYDMEEDLEPAISKITLGDAEEYFDDLGLEYNVDYKDDAKEKQDTKKKTTRQAKNEELNKEVEEKIKQKKIEEKEKKLEITKENMKPKTAKEIKKIKKITDLDDMDDLKEEPKEEEPDEKNLYDLIDMMYESKE